MEITLNGVRRTVRGAPDRPLLFVLRDELDLTGAKYGCGEGQCGACTVLLDNVAVRSCLTPLKAAEGKRIVTIEGLAQEGKLHPVQQAFLDTDAMQCGYCTAGMILSACSLLHKNRNPNATAIKAGLQGNVCRCGTYGRIVEAVQIASKAMREENTHA